jgi:hypothetical protein
MPESAQIRDLFDRARDLDLDDRSAFLDEACPAAIRGELDRLLEDYQRLTTVAAGAALTRAANVASGSGQGVPGGPGDAQTPLW